jgi:hypothetical protein
LHGKGSPVCPFNLLVRPEHSHQWFNCRVQPPANVLEAFQGAVAPMFRLVHTLSLKNNNLRTTRDLLLPKLVSGEVSVDAVENSIQEAATI